MNAIGTNKPVKRTLMFKNQELLDFEADPATKEVRVLDAPEAHDALLNFLGFGVGTIRRCWKASRTASWKRIRPAMTSRPISPRS